MAEVLIHNNDIDQALKSLRRKLQKEGTFRYRKMKQFFEEGAAKAKRKRFECLKRHHKMIKALREAEE